jgi:hypothetical protein
MSNVKNMYNTETSLKYFIVQPQQHFSPGPPNHFLETARSIYLKYVFLKIACLIFEIEK